MPITLSDEAIEAVIKARLQYYLCNEDTVYQIWGSLSAIEAIIEQFRSLKALQQYLQQEDKQ